MGWEAWFTLGTLVVVLVALGRSAAPPDMVLWGGTVLVTVAGIVDPSEALAGFANPGVLTVAALFVVAAALRETGALDIIGNRILGPARDEAGALRRMIPQVLTLSAFLNNTAVVAMMMPVATEWCRRARVSPARVLMPISFLSILGGMCTLIGTSTNLVVNGLMRQTGRPDLAPMYLLELAWVGLPCAAVGAAYLYFFGRRLLPDRKDLIEEFGDSMRQYVVELQIQPGCPLVGQQVEAAGLRRLPGLFLVEVTRAGRVIAPVAPDEVLVAGDRLTFAGVVSMIFHLERIPGLVPVADGSYATDAVERRQRRYCEAVISASSPLIGKTIRDSNFRATYNAAVIAVHRGRARLSGRIGDIKLRPGDTLLLQAGAHFADANRNNPDFYLVSAVTDTRPVRHDKTWLALGLMGLLIGLLLLGPQIGMPTVVAAFLVAGLLIVSRCISAADARRAVALDVLLAIAAAFGLSAAIQNAGLDRAIAHAVVSISAAGGPWTALAVIYAATVLVSTLITNNATAVLMFPIAISIAGELGVSPRAFAIAITLGAAASFATPMSYQTNMMIYGPGGYRFVDYLRVGLPLNLLLWGVVVVVLPLVWPL